MNTIDNLNKLMALATNPAITLFSTQSGVGSISNYVGQIITPAMLDNPEGSYIANGTVYITKGQVKENTFIPDRDCLYVCKVLDNKFTPAYTD